VLFWPPFLYPLLPESFLDAPVVPLELRPLGVGRDFSAFVFFDVQDSPAFPERLLEWQSIRMCMA